MQKIDKYLSGFHNHHHSESLDNALPIAQNSPQKPAYGLYTEQLSGTAFTVPRRSNLRSWLYRIRPSVMHKQFHPLEEINNFIKHPIADPQPPNQLRSSAYPFPDDECDFIEGIIPIAFNDSREHYKAGIYLYMMNRSMNQRYFYNADGDFLFILQEGKLQFNTEFGCICAGPGEIVNIPRGIKFQILLLENNARGYLCENKGSPFVLPELGPIGANGLANPRDFYYPQAQFEDLEGEFELICKYQNNLWQAQMMHSPLDVVAWHGNYAPYKYNLESFNTINTVSFDHPDPSIFTVLTSQTNTPGVANIDFVIFPDRWMVAENTFRPPYFHRNIMNEFMGLIKGQYDAKEEGFEPGGFSIHNCMSAHGPDVATFEKARDQELKPQRYKGTLAFMLESNGPWNVTENMLHHPMLQKNYTDCWQGFKKYFG